MCTPIPIAIIAKVEPYNNTIAFLFDDLYHERNLLPKYNTVMRKWLRISNSSIGAWSGVFRGPSRTRS